MNLEDSQQVLRMGALVCAFGVILNLFMLKKRGTSAALLAGAFLFLGAVMLLYASGFSLFLIVPLAVVTLSLLVVDFVLRLRNLGGQ